jgi:hypothetical protein
MLLSAFACPGAGQFMQKRWVAGVVFASGFLVGFFWLMVVALGIIISFYRMGFDSDYEPETPNIMALLPPLAIAVVFYLMNLFDVVIAQLRIQQQTHTDLFTAENHEDHPL